MLLYVVDSPAALSSKTTGYLAYCPRCKDRKRFDVAWPSCIVCNCTVAKWRQPTNAIRVSAVRGTFNPDHKCDGWCLNATGHNCECSCGGKNHGAGH